MKDYSGEGVFKMFIAYAAFTALDFPYELYLALRFFIARGGSLDIGLKRYAFLHNLACVRSETPSTSDDT